MLTYASSKVCLLGILPLAIFAGLVFGLPQVANAVGICPGDSRFAVVGFLQTCIDASNQPLKNPDGSIVHSFTTAQVMEWANSNGTTLAEMIEGGKVVGETAIMREDACGPLDISACFRVLWDQFVAFIGFLPAALGAFLLIIAGHLFNFLLDHTVAEFGTFIASTGVREGINITWTAFRDISNIVIIGMFTFIAISLILGIKEYGERKMIARVLIVAVLINFSLLFAKVIIDASNFTALQFYKAAQLETGVGGEGASSNGISGAFLESMGATTVGDLYNVLYEQQSSKGGEFWKTILFGFLTGILFFLAAAVLLYGSFLLLARAILLIFLMITAPLAFASWLIPKFAQEGWHKWWDTLLKNAIFGPVLMIMLWVSLLMTSQLQKNGGTIGSLVAEPGNALGIEAMFSYLIILGMLFLSIKVASKFSGTIAGFGTAMTAMAAPFTLANRFAAAPLMRGTFGRWGARAEERKKEALGTARTHLATIGAPMRELEREKAASKNKKLSPEKERELADLQGKYRSGVLDTTRLIRQTDRRGAIAKGSFNVMNTGTAKTVAETVGLKGIAAGADKKSQGFADTAKARAEAAAKTAAELSMSSADKEKLQIQKEKELRDAHRGREDQLNATRKSAAEQKQTQEEAIQAQKSMLDDLAKRRDTAKGNTTVVAGDVAKRKDEIRTRYDSEIESLRTQIAAARDSGTETRTLEQQRGVKMRERDTQLKEQDERISSARATAQTIEARIDSIYKPLRDAEQELRSADKAIVDFNKEIVDDAKKSVDAIAAQSKDVAADVGATIAHQRWSNVIPRALGQSPQNDYMARQARSLTQKKIGAKGVKARQQADKEILQEAGEGGSDKSGGGGGGSEEKKK